ncbi:creatininase family protein [Arenibaculum pallidiluteum]|uniref:creatininase family protein n=1 Tax=Arenibaculum pallidiluteum TaxID=2812559 RepID=UPI001A95BA86|nr:creatininase family protein [Arenibaculum pallidiluteum]
MELPRRRWQDMTAKEFAAVEEPERVVAVLPVGSVEQHGPHLPVWCDGALVEGILDGAAARMPPDMPVLAMPMLPYGFSMEHTAYPGTLSISAETLVRLLVEIGEGVHRTGLRRLVILNGHGGQTQVLDIVARELRMRLGMLVVPCSWWRLGMPDNLFPSAELAHGIHGGAVETSMMLHLAAPLVNRGEIRNFESLGREAEAEFRHLSATGPVAFAWAAQDLNPLGVCGDARLAEARHGQALVEKAAGALVGLLAEVARFPLDALKDRI